MTWTFHIVAVEGQRLFSRILQVLEGQRAHVRMFAGEINDQGVYITATITSEDDRAYRIEALLYRLEDVPNVSVSQKDY
jgi:hypothetical protein